MIAYEFNAFINTALFVTNSRSAEERRNVYTKHKIALENTR